MKNHLPLLLTTLLSLSFAARPSGAFAQNPGSLDLSFDPGAGLGTNNNPHVLTTAVQSDERIVIGGQFWTYNGTPRNHIARLDADGSLDATFNPGAGADNIVRTTAIQSDGKIVVGGMFTTYNGVSRNRIARLNADGSLDATFIPVAGASDVVFTTAIQSDGKIIVGGQFTTYAGTPRNRIARLNADGSLDLTFDPGAGADWDVRTIAIQSDGMILIGGMFFSYDGTPMNRIARLNADGSLDATFSIGAGANGTVGTIVLQSDGKILISGGFSSYNGMALFRIARLNPDGTLDTTFNPVSAANNSVETTLIQGDGKIVIGGYFTSYTGTPRNHVARLNSDGSLDSTFNPGAGANDVVFASAIQSDGRVVIGGYFTDYDGMPRNHIARLYGGQFTGIGGQLPSEFAIFPNPASSLLTINLPEQQGRAGLVLRNALGQVVLRSRVAAGRNDIPLNGLASGLYTVQVSGTNSQRLVVE